MTAGPSLDPRPMFEDVFAIMPPHLLRQRQQLDEELAAAAKDAPAAMDAPSAKDAPVA